jgi:hypothetical protein
MFQERVFVWGNMLDYEVAFARGERQKESKATGIYYPTHSYTIGMAGGKQVNC